MASSPTSAYAYPPALESHELSHLTSVIKDYALAHGLVVRPAEIPSAVREGLVTSNDVLATPAPVTLYPSAFPRKAFQIARKVQKSYNELYAGIAADEEFLKEIVEEIVDVDQFIADLWQVHLKVKAIGFTQKLSLGLFRSDYMVHQNTTTSEASPIVKQVEFNTIASSFGGLSSHTSSLHRYLSIESYPNKGLRPERDQMPTNTSTESLAHGLRQAFEAYTTTSTTKAQERCILFIVQTGERNVFDQRHLEYELQLKEPAIPVFRLEFADILKHTSLADSPTRQLLYKPPHNPSQPYEVAVVYFRAGYGPQDYSDQTSWDARFQIEASSAIKCPTILTQLAGAKKVQQVLATPRLSASDPSPLERFLGNSAHVSSSSSASPIAQIEQTFTNIFPLDASSAAGREARRIALDAELCAGYVLKPQREGGGNNTYKRAIPAFMREVGEERWKSYILMEIIRPPPVRNLILRNGAVESGGVICELGIYGTCLWEKGDAAKGEKVRMIFNDEAGYLLRTKGDQSEEGGVAAGFGAMDSVLLV